MVAVKVFHQNTTCNCPKRKTCKLVYMVSSTKRKMGQQKIIPNINESLRQATVPMLMTSSVTQLVLKMFLACVWFCRKYNTTSLTWK